MAYEQNNNSGSLFRNDKDGVESRPDYRGSALIDGVEYWMDSWLKTSKDGKKWMSFSFKPKEAREPAPQVNHAPQRDTRTHGERKRQPINETRGDGYDESIPF